MDREGTNIDAKDCKMVARGVGGPEVARRTCPGTIKEQCEQEDRVRNIAGVRQKDT